MADEVKIVQFDQWEQQLKRKQGKDGSAVVVKPQDGFSRDRNRANIAPSLENALHAIRELSITFRYDLFRGKVVIENYDQPLGESLDDIELKVRQVIIKAFGFDPEGKHTRDAIRLLALENAFDPVREYLDGLKWDGVSRIDTWLTVYLGAPDEPLTRAIGRAILIAGVRRVRKPGAKFDHAMILEGPQGSGKSTALKVLAGGEMFFSDEIVVGQSYKEAQELLRGKWIVELPELVGLSKSDVKAVKQFITKTTDRGRPAFARSVEELPRRCILIGTTNDADYLQDPTGNRRFWPVVTGKIDLAALKEDRDQLWAEAAALEPEADDPITLPSSLWAAAAAAQAERVAPDPWDDVLMLGLPGVVEEVNGELRVTTKDILDSVLKLGLPMVRDTRRLGERMRLLGWTGPKPIRTASGPLSGYVKRRDDAG